MSSTGARRAAVARALAATLATASLLVATSLAAAHAYGSTFPSLFVDPFGGFSVVLLPSWQSAEMDIGIGEPVRAAQDDGDASVLPAERLARAAARAESAGAHELALRIGSGDDERVVALELRRIGASEILWFYALYVLAGLLLLWSGVTVAIVAWHRPGGRAYLGLSVIGFVFLVTFLDYQTTRWLAPLFAATTLGNAVGLFALAWWFPEPPDVSEHARRLVAAAIGAGVVLCVVLALGVATDIDLRPLRQLADVLVPCALLVLLGSVAWRHFGKSEGGSRAELRSAAWGLFLVPLAFAVTFLVLLATSQLSIFHMALPFVSVTVPGAVGHALIRHNALAVRAVVTRRLMAVPTALVALGVGASAAWPLVGSGRWLEPSFVGTSVTASIAMLGWVGLGRLLSPPEARFQPALEGLADEVAALRTPDAIRSHLRELIHRCMPSRDVSTRAAQSADMPPLTEQARARFATGETVWSETEGVALPALVAPLRFGGEPLGAVIVAPRPGDPLFTEGEIRIIQTIVRLGALALHHAELLREVEERRAIELVATRGDKLLAVDVLAAEIAHELAYPIGFLRHFLKQVTSGRPSEDAIEVGQEEVERLERMLAWVRKLQLPSPALSPVRVGLVVSHVLVLLEGDLAARGVTCAVDVPDDLEVMADQDGLLQLVANLLRNAAQAARVGGRIGVTARLDATGQPELRVSDDGAGIPAEIASKLFDPLFTTQGEGHGLGLAVAQRVARHFGWSIEVAREGDRTVFFTRARRAGQRAASLERAAS